MPVLILLLLAQPFWELKPASEWSNEELERIYYRSPWGQEVASGASAPATVAYLATAKPMRDAEAETTRRFLPKGATMEPGRGDYELLLRESPDKLIVLAVRVKPSSAMADQAELQTMMQESVLKVGRRTLRVMAHFAPAQRDPWLRLAFPREVRPSDKALEFQIYVPGLPAPYRQLRFALKDLGYKGKPEY